MELRQIRYFVVLAAELSFTRAAQRLHVSQPPLSLQIANLETELGARLFDRTSRSVALSEAGKAFLPHAQAILARLDEARSHVERIASGLQGQVRVGLAGSHFLGPFPEFILRFRRLRPAVEVVLKEMMPSDHLQALLNGQIDLSVSRNPLHLADGSNSSTPDDVLGADLLWRDPIVAALSPCHRLAGRTSLALAELKGEDFVFLRLSSSPFAGRLFDACVQAGFAPHIVQQVVEIPAVLNLVAAGLGIALVPSSLAALRKDAVSTCTLQPSASGELPNGDVYVLGRTADAPSTVAEFRRLLLDWAAGHPIQAKS